MAAFSQQWCAWASPSGKYNSIPSTSDLSQFNKFGGFNIKADHQALIDGGHSPSQTSLYFHDTNFCFQAFTDFYQDFDPWLNLCYHSNFATAHESPGVHPEYLIAGAGHHYDSYGILDNLEESLLIRQAHFWEIKTVQKWLKRFPDWRLERTNHGTRFKIGDAKFWML